MAAFSLSDRLFGRRTARSTALARRPAPVPWALVLMIPAICLYYIAAFILVSLRAPIELAALVMITLGMVNSVLSAAILMRLRGYELPSEQRRHVRIDVDLDANLDGVPCRVNNLSLGGASIVAASASTATSGDDCKLEFEVHGERFVLKTTIVRRVPLGAQSEFALRYREGQGDTVARIAMALLSESGPERAADLVDPLPLSA